MPKQHCVQSPEQQQKRLVNSVPKTIYSNTHRTDKNSTSISWQGFNSYGLTQPFGNILYTSYGNIIQESHKTNISPKTYHIICHYY